MRWTDKYNGLACEEQIDIYCKQLGVSKFLARLLLPLNFERVDQAFRFLNPSLQHFEDPSNIKNLNQLVDVLDHALRSGQAVGVISDYDVDGITSIALLQRCCRALNYQFKPFFPERETEGYGLSMDIVKRVLSNGHFDVIIALDCGTNSVEAVDFLNQQGVSVLIIDHHQKNCQTLPKAIIVNPHLDGQTHSISSKQLCTVGLVFKLIHAWLKRLKAEQYPPAQSIRLRPFLDLVALGTVADMVPLTEENRLFVHFGLKELQQSGLVGLKSLLKYAGIEEDNALTTDDVSFRLAPRINVSGRLGSAYLPFRLLTSQDVNLCNKLAKQLNQLNSQRQEIEKEILEEAQRMIAQRSHRALTYVLYNENWHIGVVGIVAGKLTHQYGKPIFVLGKKGDFAKGSGRSIPEVDLVHLFQKAGIDAKQWGGHPAAVGLMVEPHHVALLEEKLNQALYKMFQHGFPEPTLSISASLDLEDLTDHLLEEVERVAPFGQGNESPTFVLRNISLTKKPERFGSEGAHMRLSLNGITTIGWGMGSVRFPSDAVDLAVKITWNYWRGKKVFQLQLVDWKRTS